MEMAEMARYELLEWHDRRYQHVKYVTGTEKEVKQVEKSLNKGYTGPRFVMREVQAW